MQPLNLRAGPVLTNPSLWPCLRTAQAGFPACLQGQERPLVDADQPGLGQRQWVSAVKSLCEFGQGILSAASSAKQVETLQCVLCAVLVPLSTIIKAPIGCCRKHTEQAHAQSYAGNLSSVLTYNGSGSLTLTQCPHHHIPEALHPQLLTPTLIQDPSWLQVPAQKPTQSCSKTLQSVGLCAAPHTIRLSRPGRS